MKSADGGHRGQFIPAPGDTVSSQQGCSYYIRRHRRTCNNRSAPGADACHDHSAEVLEANRAKEILRRKDQAAAAVAATSVCDTTTDDSTDKTKRISSSVRRMANPLAKQHQQPIVAPSLHDMYDDPTLPLHVDIGCARGLFVEELAWKQMTRNQQQQQQQQQPQQQQLDQLQEWNYLGIELRDFLVEEARVRVRARASSSLSPPPSSQTPTATSSPSPSSTSSSSLIPPLGNLAFIAGNINVSVKSLFEGSDVVDSLAEATTSLLQVSDPTTTSTTTCIPTASLSPTGTLQPGTSTGLSHATRRLSILFPDPWRRKNHLKRAIVTASLVNELAETVGEGCEVILASDCFNVAKSMYRSFVEREDVWMVDPKAVSQQQQDRATAKESTVDDDDDDDDEDCIDYKWLPLSPFPVPTERELVCEQKWRPVWWACFIKKASQTLPMIHI